MVLYVIRHGKAVSLNEVESDKERYLTEAGREKMKIVGKGLNKIGVKADFIFSSPLKRAVETAEIIAEEIGYNVNDIKQIEGLINGHDWKEIYNYEIEGKEVVIVGHDPMFSDLVCELIGAKETSMPMKKGSVCKILVEDLESFEGNELLWFIPPKVFSAFI